MAATVTRTFITDPVRMHFNGSGAYCTIDLRADVLSSVHASNYRQARITSVRVHIHQSNRSMGMEGAPPLSWVPSALSLIRYGIAPSVKTIDKKEAFKNMHFRSMHLDPTVLVNAVSEFSQVPEVEWDVKRSLEYGGYPTIYVVNYDIAAVYETEPVAAVAPTEDNPRGVQGVRGVISPGYLLAAWAEYDVEFAGEAFMTS